MSALLFVAWEKYHDLGTVDEAVPDAYSWIPDALTARGWHADPTRKAQAEIRFGDANDAETRSLLSLSLPEFPDTVSPSDVRMQFPDVSCMGASRHVPLVATTTMMGYRTLFHLGPETLNVESFATVSYLDRLWVENNMKQGALEAVPIGIGFASGSTATMDTGSQLIRATWSDGAPWDRPRAAIQSRLALHMARASELMRDAFVPRGRAKIEHQ